MDGTPAAMPLSYVLSVAPVYDFFYFYLNFYYKKKTESRSQDSAFFSDNDYRHKTLRRNADLRRYGNQIRTCGAPFRGGHPRCIVVTFDVCCTIIDTICSDILPFWFDFM